MKKLLRIFHPNVEDGVRTIAMSTSIRWFGWGFAEAFFPIFLFSFSQTYAEAGLFRSVFGIAFLLSLPIVSWFADNIASKKLMFVSLLIYPFVSISYFFAGSLGVVAFLIGARALNGIAYALDSVGRATYVYTHTKTNNIATSFGYIDSLGNFWWLAAVFLSLAAIQYVPIHFLFLLIIPTSLISMLLVRTLPDGLTAAELSQGARLSIAGSFGSFFKTIISWSNRVRHLAALLFFVGIVATVGEFFIPIYAYTQNESLWKVVLLTAFATVPCLFSSPIGEISDRYKKHGIFWASGISAILLLILAIAPVFPVQLILVFLIGICLKLLVLTIDREVALYIPKEHLGGLSAAFQGVSSITGIIGPITLGISIDLLSMKSTLIILSACSFIFAVMYLNHHKHSLPV
ncbi:MAG: MFS transporter [Candidatus Parcubacteria bacterium]|nr:MFS transporter [Candidatus Parcubacteria bacterium]